MWLDENNHRNSGSAVPQGQVESSQTLKEFVGEAFQEKLAAKASKVRLAEPEWMQGFGKLRLLRKETARVQTRIDAAFEVIESEDRR